MSRILCSRNSSPRLAALAALLLPLAAASPPAVAAPFTFNFSATLNGHDLSGSFDGSHLNLEGLEHLNLGRLLGHVGSAFDAFGGHHRFNLGGLASLAPEFAQERFEDRFADIMADYDDGLATIDDYYNSDDYADVLADTNRLVTRYDGFVTGVERQIDFVGNAINRSNERIDHFDDLLADYQERDDLSERRLARIERWITGVQDVIQFKIDLLTERQTSLTEDLPAYQDFQMEIGDYLDEITAAGQMTGDGQALALSAGILNHSVLAAAVNQAPASTAATVQAAFVPEPSAGALALIACMAAPRLRRGARRP